MHHHRMIISSYIRVKISRQIVTISQKSIFVQHPDNKRRVILYIHVYSFALNSLISAMRTRTDVKSCGSLSTAEPLDYVWFIVKIP